MARLYPGRDHNTDGCLQIAFTRARNELLKTECALPHGDGLYVSYFAAYPGEGWVAELCTEIRDDVSYTVSYSGATKELLFESHWLDAHETIHILKDI